MGKMRGGKAEFPIKVSGEQQGKAWPGEVTTMRSKVRGHRNVEAAPIGGVHRISCVSASKG